MWLKSAFDTPTSILSRDESCIRHALCNTRDNTRATFFSFVNDVGLGRNSNLLFTVIRERDRGSLWIFSCRGEEIGLYPNPRRSALKLIIHPPSFRWLQVWRHEHDCSKCEEKEKRTVFESFSKIVACDFWTFCERKERMKEWNRFSHSSFSNLSTKNVVHFL